MIKDWKTTLTAIIGAIAVVAANFGFELSAEQQVAIVTVVLLIIGLFAADSKKGEK